MIEIEKKFHLTAEQEKKLLDGAEFIKEKHINDVYFDNSKHDLTCQDWWLRKRNGQFELKTAIPNDDKHKINQYIEINNEHQIRKKLNLKSLASLDEDLLIAGYHPFIACRTTRRTYHKQNFIIDLDIVEYDSDITYIVAEIELQVESENQIPEAKEKIFAFAKQHQLADEQVRGKIIEYLRQKRPEHYKALLNAEVIKE